MMSEKTTKTKAAGVNPVVKANDFYEAELAAERPVTVAEVEVKFGLKKYQLVNFRKKSPRLAAMEALPAVSVDSPLERDMERDLIVSVQSLGKLGGTVMLTRQRIAVALGLGEDLQGRDWSLNVMDALIDRDVSVKGILNRDGAETKRLLAAAIPEVRTATASGSQLVTVPLSQVVVCPLNPRKRIDDASIDEMADSISAVGILQNPLARMKGGVYEVVFGQRRLLGARRVAERSGSSFDVAAIELKVRQMSDREALELAWVENLQKVDVAVRDEAEGFQAMLDLKDLDGRPVYSIRTLAEKFGKSKTFVSDRLKLKGVPEEMWDALEAGVIGVKQMERVGRMPDEASRKKLAAAILRPKYRSEPPLSVKETDELIREDFMVSLRGCGWSMKDVDLVTARFDEAGERTGGGACQDCPFRTGSDPELVGALSSNDGKRGADANSCLLPSCFAAKRKAYWRVLKGTASAEGSRVLSDEEAKKVFQSWGGDVPTQASGLVNLTASPGYMETGHHAGSDTMPAWEKLLKVIDPEDLVIARNEYTETICRLMKRDRAVELAELAMGVSGKDSPFANRPGAVRPAGGDDDGEDDDADDSGSGQREETPEIAEWRRKRDKERAAEEAAMSHFQALIELQKNPTDDAVIELVLGMNWLDVGYGGSEGMVWMKAHGFPEFEEAKDRHSDEQVREWLDTVMRPEVARAPLAWLAFMVMASLRSSLDLHDAKQGGPIFTALGIDVDALLEGESDSEESAA